uniref:Cyanidin 3-O-galactoside 2''-O-xylosyltransferase FGGT1 n=1 Tax=Actinidia chinensis var. chinensis TaxID=1590841 RepID=F3GGT_ACTCC|nr:RecName: Full=Cyanidin 3-O-galactoside 2''-O-xylosyltransferase FGGT1; AltName: Full=Flavonoid 3-O-glycoside glycosyltransferase 1; AltName: Full=UDP-xylose flavonoid O-glycosyltransferase 6B; Short=AcUFGT6b [Actinidia chinensis var. chinensis]
MGAPTFHIAMYPWFALGHLTPFLHLSNKLARKGHKISFLIPTKTQQKLEPFNLHPDLITFIPVTVPHVDGLPLGAETTSDVPYPLQTLLMTAMDRTEKYVEDVFLGLKVDVVFFDFTHWMPSVAKRLGIKSVNYCIISPATIGYTMSPARQLQGRELTEADLMVTPLGYPDSSIRLRTHEARAFAARRVMKFGGDTRFCDRNFISFSECDAMGFKTCREIEGPYCDFLESQFEKPVLLSGPVIPEPPTSPLEEIWAKWLGGFRDGSVIYCAFGSECTLKMNQFQELLLGLVLTGMPFLAVLKPPIGAKSVEEALPEKFETSVEGRGVVHEGWVQQQLILEHPSVGCFITHCGSGSLSEALFNKCQLVLLPNVGDQIINARMMSQNLKVGVEVEKGEEDGLFTGESVCRAVRDAMEEGSEVAKEVRDNHAKMREFLLNKDLESSYIDNFNKKLQDLLG